MSVIWSYGGKLVEADNKTVALHSPGTVKAVQLIADMYLKHKIIPKGAISWDNTGNNKAYQSRQVIFVQNATSIYAHLADSDKELYDTTGLLPMPAGPAGAFATLGATYWTLFKHNPYPEVAKGLVEYWMAPENLRVMIEEGDGRWGPPYKGMYDSDFWKRPVFTHWRGMLETRPPSRLPRHGASRRRRGDAHLRAWPHDAPGAGGELGGREGRGGSTQEGRGDLRSASGGLEVTRPGVGLKPNLQRRSGTCRSGFSPTVVLMNWYI